MTALILGAGPNLGNSIASTFANVGYKIALVSRSADITKSTDKLLYVQADLSHSDAVPEAFDAVRQAFGHPNIVVYNGQHLQRTHFAEYN